MSTKTLEERLELYVTEKGCKDGSSNKLLLAASAVAGVGAILVPPPAEAAIVYSGVLQNNNIVSIDSGPQVVDFGGNADFLFKFSFDPDASSYPSFIQKLAVDTIGPEAVIRNPNNNKPAYMEGNYTVSSGKVFFNVTSSDLAASNSSVEGNFLNKQGFLGVKFEINNNAHYGWIQYKSNADASIGTIIDWAYENTPGKAIKTGDKSSFNWNIFLPAIINGKSD